MAYVGGLYTKASEASAAEAKRFRDFQTNIDEMGARERAGLYRRDQANMDQFTAGLRPQSSIPVPDLTMPAAPPMPAASLPKTGGGADSGGAAKTSYERDRRMQERKLLENQFNSEVTAQQTIIDDLGQQKYILEQQLTAAPAHQQQAIRDRLTTLNDTINRTVTGTRARLTAFGKLFEDIDTAIRLGDKTGALTSGALIASGDTYAPGALTTERTKEPADLGTGASRELSVPDSLDMPPEAPAPQPGAATTPPPAQVAPDSQAFIASLTPAQFNALPKDKQDAVLAAVNRERLANRDRANYMTIPAAASDLAVGPINALAYVFNWASEAGDLPRYARAIGLGDVTSIQTPYVGADESGSVTATPYTDVLRRLRQNSEPLTREQFLENLKANEQQAVAPGKAGLQTAGVSSPSTPEAAAAATPALNMTPDVAIGDPANPRVAAITQYSAKSVADRAPKLVANVGTVVTSKRGQEIINRAKALGVDPAAAIAIYGVETSFGAKGGKNKAGAGGPLQVMASDWPGFQKWFKAPANRKRYGITDAMVAAANAANYDSIDAGLLRIKYNELVGVDKNLWGAAYQASAEKVRQAGGPLPVHDAGKEGTQGLTNSDYNKLYVEVYNEARSFVNIPPRTITSQEGIVGSSQVIRQLDAQEQQLVSNYEFDLSTFDAERQANLAKLQELERRVQIAQEYGDIDAYNTAVTESQALADIDRDINIRLRNAETKARLEYDTLNLARTEEYVNMAVMELEGKNTEPFSDMVSRGLGMLIEIRPIEGGKFAVHQNNELISGKGYTLEEVKDQYLAPISSSFAAQRNAQREAEAAWNREQLAADLKLGRDITLEQAKATVEQDGWAESKDAVTDPNTGQITERWFSKTGPDGKLRTIRMRIAPDREENGLRIKGGVTVEEAGGLK
jgi:hypothetical protein